MLSLLSAGLPACSTTATTNTASYNGAIAEGRAAVEDALKDGTVTSISLALVDGERVVWTETFGLADKAANRPPAAETMYGIGSTSKMIAAIAAMKLVDEGKIALDDPLVMHLPTFSMLSPDYAKVTIRMLLSHSSGFPGGDYRGAFTNTPRTGYAEQVLESLKGEYLKHTPGYLHTYCNDGFTLIELLVKAKTGKDFATYVQEEIFAPLGMNHSRYPVGYFPAGSFATTYSNGAAETQEFGNPFATGGLYSTPSDMARVAIMLLNGGRIGPVRILSENAIKEMGRDQTAGSFDPESSTHYRFGLGWDSVAAPALKASNIAAWCKGGDSRSYHSALIVAPSERLAVIVEGASAFSSSAAEKIGNRILLRLLADLGRITGMPQKLSPAVSPAATIDIDRFNSFAGIYAAFNNAYRISFSDNQTLTFETFEAATKKWTVSISGLKYRQDGWFAVDSSPSTQLKLLEAEGRRYIAVKIAEEYDWQEALMAQKLPDTAAIDAAWSTMAGKWLTVNESPDVNALGPLVEVLTLPGKTSPLFVYADGMWPVNGHMWPVIPTATGYAGPMLLIPGGMGSRDLFGLRQLPIGTETWLLLGSYVLRPLNSVPSLAAGANSITIGSEGYAEFRTLPTGASSTEIVNDGAWKLFDENFKLISEGKNAQFISISPGSKGYLLLFGQPNTQRKVTVL